MHELSQVMKLNTLSVGVAGFIFLSNIILSKITNTKRHKFLTVKCPSYSLKIRHSPIHTGRHVPYGMQKQKY